MTAPDPRVDEIQAIPAEAVEHPIYFERTSDGETWPACGCGEVQLMTDDRSVDEWIAAHHSWKESA